MIRKNRGEAKGLAARGQSILREFQLKIESAELKVRRGDICDQGADHGTATPLCGEQGGASGFCGAAILSPEIKLPGGGEIQLSGGLLECGKDNRFRTTLRGKICASAEIG